MQIHQRSGMVQNVRGRSKIVYIIILCKLFSGFYQILHKIHKTYIIVFAFSLYYFRFTNFSKKSFSKLRLYIIINMLALIL